MRHLVWLLNVVEFAAPHRFPVLTRLWTPPVDLVGARCTEDFHTSRPIRQVAAQFLVDVEVPGRGRIEAGEHGLLVAARLSGFLEFGLGVAVLAEHPLEGDVSEYLLPADGTPEELEQCLTVSVKYFEGHWLTHPVVPGHHLVPGRKTAPSAHSLTVRHRRR